ncbi:hypothetical protein [Yinghuangia sp. YIM S09857]|uniref:hypothetical protein n=1 Tax=Yinghuangia sp. YIM S09857 TaxID=3436929 RepID=UPI003F52E2CC
MSIEGLVPAQSVLADDRDVAAVLEGGSRFNAADGTVFVLGDAATAMIVAAADDLPVSGVRSAGEVAVVGPLPEALVRRMVAHYRCHESGDFVDWRLPVHVFVRVATGLLYMGTASDEGLSTATMAGELVEQIMELVPAADRALLDVVRPIDDNAPLPGVDWLDAARQDRVAAMRDFVTGWHWSTFGLAECVIGPAAVDGPLPRALAELYRLADGRHQHVLGAYETILTPDELRVKPATGRLEFGWGCEGDWSWACDLAEDDPAVWWTWDGIKKFTRREPERLSGFLLRHVLMQAATTAIYRAVSSRPYAPASVIGEVTAGLARAPVQSLDYDAGRSAIHVAPGLVVIVTHVTDDECFVTAGATHRRALRPFVGLDLNWDEFAG